MLKTTLIGSIILSVSLGVACGTTENSTNSANSAGNKPVITNNPANLPEGLSPKPIEPSGNATPGIPDPKTVNANSIPKGTTPTPGIPDPTKPTPQAKNTPKIPGIPTEEELKKMQNQKVDPSVVNDPKEAQKLVNQGKGESKPEKKPMAANKPQ